MVMKTEDSINLNNIKKIKFQMIATFGGTFTFLTVCLAIFIVSQANRVLMTKVAALEQVTNNQLCLNLDSCILQSELYGGSIRPSDIEVFLNHTSSLKLNTLILDQTNRIIYATDKNEVGRDLPLRIIEYLKNEDEVHIYKNSLYSFSNCCNEWKLITYAPLKDVLPERQKIIAYTLVISFIAISLTIIACIIFSIRFTIPMENLISSLHMQATRDKLTKFLNVSTFENLAQETLKLEVTQKQALFYFDIDHFNSIIEIKGRSESEKIIYDVANILRRVFPKNALLGRLGSDRFAILLSMDNNQNTKQMIEQYCEKINQDLFSTFHSDFDITISAGIAFYPDHGKSYNILYDMASRAMVYVKKNGRNSWHIFNPDTDLNSI